MLEPTNKTIHTILQPPKEVSLSCHVQTPKRKANNPVNSILLINLQYEKFREIVLKYLGKKDLLSVSMELNLWISEDRIDKMFDELYRQAAERNLTSKLISLVILRFKSRLEEYEKLKWRKEANFIKSVLDQLRS